MEVVNPIGVQRFEQHRGMEEDGIGGFGRQMLRQKFLLRLAGKDHPRRRQKHIFGTFLIEHEQFMVCIQVALHHIHHIRHMIC